MKLRFFLVFFSILFSMQAFSQKKVYEVNIHDEINSTTWLYIKNGLEEADKINADLFIIDMNTYGGLVVFADSIMSALINSDIPTAVYIQNNAASAGALISIACDNIYMRPGSSIGAATVVDQSGVKQSDKVQSYMRSKIRSIAESHGKDTLIVGTDTSYVWKRDPQISEAMIDDGIVVEGLVDSTHIVTFTTDEAIEYGFCEGKAHSIEEAIEKYGFSDYELITYKPSFYTKLKGFLTSPMLSGLLISIIVLGIFIEIRTPGIGLPLLASCIAAVLYFAPLYMDGLANNWEIAMFIVGLILIMLEIFVIPGFGIAGISGFALAFIGLVLSLIGNVDLDFSGVDFSDALKSLVVVICAISIAIVAFFPISKHLMSKGRIASVVTLQTTQKIEDGFISFDNSLKDLVGSEGVSVTRLRPSGKVEIDNEQYDAVAMIGVIEKNAIVKVRKFETGQLYVEKV